MEPTSVGTIHRKELLRRLQDAAVAMLSATTEATARHSPASNATMMAFAGACVAFSGPESPLSRAIGVGCDAPVTISDVEVIEDFYTSRGSPIRFAISERTEPQFVETLRQRGYSAEPPMQNWWIDLAHYRPHHVTHSAFRIDVADESNAELWAENVATGFEENDRAVGSAGRDVVETFRCLGFADDTLAFIALNDEHQMAGGAALSICDDTAFLRTCSCRWQYRNRGVQTHLISARLAQAAESGCDIAFSTTQGDGASLRNLIRAGFQPLSQTFVMSKGLPGPECSH
jgi:hypothetical protein